MLIKHIQKISKQKVIEHNKHTFKKKMMPIKHIQQLCKQNVFNKTNTHLKKKKKNHTNNKTHIATRANILPFITQVLCSQQWKR